MTTPTPLAYTIGATASKVQRGAPSLRRHMTALPFLKAGQDSGAGKTGSHGSTWPLPHAFGRPARIDMERGKLFIITMIYGEIGKGSFVRLTAVRQGPAGQAAGSAGEERRGGGRLRGRHAPRQWCGFFILLKRNRTACRSSIMTDNLALSFFTLIIREIHSRIAQKPVNGIQDRSARTLMPPFRTLPAHPALRFRPKALAFRAFPKRMARPCAAIQTSSGNVVLPSRGDGRRFIACKL